MPETERIYIAGKISPNDWRRTIANCIDTRDIHWLRSEDNYDLFNFPWPTIENAVLGKHSYTGPFFLNCDHGCGHGPHSHGNGIRSVGCFNVTHSSNKEALIQRLCFDAIRRSTFVFAWIDSPDAYGSLIEIGYALGQSVPAYIAWPKPLNDLWFARVSSTECFQADSPESGLEHALSLRGHNPSRWQRIARENPFTPEPE